MVDKMQPLEQEVDQDKNNQNTIMINTMESDATNIADLSKDESSLIKVKRQYKIKGKLNVICDGKLWTESEKNSFLVALDLIGKNYVKI